MPRPKCAFVDCELPVKRKGSKYCSRDHLYAAQRALRPICAYPACHIQLPKSKHKYCCKSHAAVDRKRRQALAMA